MRDGGGDCLNKEDDGEIDSVKGCLIQIANSTEYNFQTYEEFNWNSTFGQADCWLKFSDAYGWDSVTEWQADPFAADNKFFSFWMPNTREYEHFYNDPDCSQIFRMGRGKEQPDAITFHDVPLHDHNALAFNDVNAITPWLTHDVLVLQFFGITEQCVKLVPDESVKSKGLVEGQFRIEYYNNTGLATIDSDAFGIDDTWSTEVTSGTGVSGGLLEAEVCVCRTPHYLAICVDDEGEGKEFCDPKCSLYCEYHPAFNHHDHSLGVDHYGNYSVSCEVGNVFTFNGTTPHNETPVSLPEKRRVNALVFEDKCDADVFIFWWGQIIVVEGNLTGPMEVLIAEDCRDPSYSTAMDGSDVVIFEFYDHNTGVDAAELE